MTILINNSKPANLQVTRFSSPSVSYDIPCSQKPLCAVKNNFSFINKNNHIYTKKNSFIKTETTIQQNYPGYASFGRENTVQNIYSADPQKLRIGIF